MGEWALARVNLFLEMKDDKSKINIQKTPVDSGAKTSTFEIDVVFSQEILDKKEEFDLTGSLIPSDKNFEQAASDIKEHGLNYDFQNIDELYLEDYKPIGFVW